MVADMSSLLFGLALIAATLQTALAMIAEGHLYAVPVLIVLLYIGWRFLKRGTVHLRHRVNNASCVAADSGTEI